MQLRDYVYSERRLGLLRRQGLLLFSTQKINKKATEDINSLLPTKGFI